MENNRREIRFSNTGDKIANLIIRRRAGDTIIPDYIGFSSNIWMVFGLPTRRLEGNPAFWTKRTSLCELTITRHMKYEIPWGCYARMNQIFIDTEVREKGTNKIDIGRSFREYTKKLGYHDGGANRTLIRQLVNYVTSVIAVDPAKENVTPNRIMGMHSVVAKKWEIFFDVKNPEQLSLFDGKIILSEDYAKWVYQHSVPIDMNVINCFKRNPMALDFYRFLAYRNNSIHKTLEFPDHLLFEQLGTEQEADFVTRARLRKILKVIQMYWPVKAQFEGGSFILEPSLPAVPYKAPSKRQMRIVMPSLNDPLGPTEEETIVTLTPPKGALVQFQSNR